MNAKKRFLIKPLCLLFVVMVAVGIAVPMFTTSDEVKCIAYAVPHDEVPTRPGKN